MAMEPIEHNAHERVRAAYLAWRGAQMRRVRAAARAIRLALELKEANERLERETHARAETLERMKQELAARAAAASAGHAQRMQRLADEFNRLAPAPHTRPIASGLIFLTLVLGLALPASIETSTAEPRQGEPLALKPSESLSLRKAP
jgi:hypothetical protein